MEDSNKKIRALAFLLAAALVAITVEVLFESLAVSFGSVARLRNNETFRHGIPIVLGLISFLILQFNGRIRVWADECISEVRKVVWPSKQEVTAMTVVVCVMVGLLGLGLGIFDLVSGQLVTAFVQTNFLSFLN